MVHAKFTIKNYRCFSSSLPLEFELRDGFTAFIGPNNSGKSIILKFFYEFRPIWSIFNSPFLDSLLREQHKITATFLGPNNNTIIDLSEIFHKFNNSDIEVSIQIGDLRFCFSINRVDKDLDNVSFLERNSKLIASGSQSIDFNNKIFNSNKGEIDISQFLELFNLLAYKTIYIPAFRNTVNIGSNENYYDIAIGDSFIKNFKNWKLGDFTYQNQVVEEVIKDIKDLFGYEELEINPSANDKSLHFKIDGKTYKLHEIGSGIIQFILVFLNVAIRDVGFILIDEPELNLHPALQQKFLMRLVSYTKNGILFATHSIGLARSISERVYSVFKNADGSSSIKLFCNTPNYPEFLGELNYTAYQELGVNKILLVEGPREVKAFQVFLRKLHKDNEVVVVPLGGSSMINGRREHELGEMKRITTSIYCWIDSEKENENSELSKDRKDFLETCRKLEIKAIASERRAIENYFSERAIKKVLGDKYTALDYYQKPNNWPKEKNWLIAEEMDLDEIKDTDLYKFLKEI